MARIRKIEVVPYDPRWREMYRTEAARIAAIFGAELIAIHHIGSTAVPGLNAKPIIDMMPLVRHIERVSNFDPAMIQLGYEPLGENSIPGRRFFVRGGDLNRTHHVHTYQPDHPEVARHLDFRDYLIAHPREARRYAQIKAELARQFPHDIDAYMAGKDAFIKDTIRQAQQWRASLLERK